MRMSKTITLTFLLLSLVALSFSGCVTKTGAAPQYETATVQRGDLAVDVTAVGNLALSHKEELAFEMAGDVAEVLVEEGDTVEKGQLLAKLDTSAWEDQLAALENSVTTAERNLTAKERALPAREGDAIQAEINRKNAEIAVQEITTTYSVSDFEVAQAEVDDAETNLYETRLKLSQYAVGSPGYVIWNGALIQAQLRLDTAKNNLRSMLSGSDSDELAIKKLQLVIAEGKLAQAQDAVEDARIAIEDARKSLEDVQKALDKARKTSPEVVAPFAGLVTLVNVQGGDEVKKGTIAVVLADPTKFEADVMIGEVDILQVKSGGYATASLDALSGVSLPAKVTHIAPSGTIQQGVVNYKVKVELESPQLVAQQPPATGQSIPADNLTSRSRQGLAGGNFTREQIDQMRQQRQQAMMGGSATGQQQQLPATLPQGFQLREGLTVTVSIRVDERNGVLLVPNQTITRRSQETYVQVLKDGVLEQRAVKTGISNWQYTEVTTGLGEGEQVAIIKTTATTATTSSSRGGLSLMPGRMR